MANGNGYTPDDYTPSQWKDAWTRGMIGQNTGMPLFPPSTQFNSRGEPYNPARVGAGGVNTAVRFPRGDEQPPPAATPAAYKPGDPPPPAPANENINDPTPPAAPAQPATPGQFSPTPWGHPQVAGIPRMPGHGGVIGNATPDGTLTPPPTSQGDRYWNPVPAQQPFGEQINQYAHQYGVPANLLSNLLRAESGFRADATGPPIPNRPYRAHGIAQFIPPTAATYHLTNPNDPDQSIRAAANYLRDLYNQKGSWAGAVAAYNGAKSIDVSQYRGSPEGRALIANAVALDGGLVKAGPLVPPPQNYRPASYTPPGGYPSMIPDRPPSQWGRDTDEMFNTSIPGMVPHEREIPGIMKALAPLLLIGLSLFSKGAALPMLSFYGGYAKARAARQTADAKLLRTQYQDAAKELKGKMSLEQSEAAYAMSLPAGSEQQKQALQEIATKYSDTQLQAVIANGGDPEKLFQLRDKMYQDVSKTAGSDIQERRLQIEEDRYEHTLKKDQFDEEAKTAKNKDEHDAAVAKAAKEQRAIDAANKALRAETAPYGDGGGSEEEPPAEKPEEAAPPASAAPAPAPSTAPTAPTAESPAPPASGSAPAPLPEVPDESGKLYQPSGPAGTPGPQSAATPPPPAADTGRDQIVDAQGNPVGRSADVVPAAWTGGDNLVAPPGGAIARALTGQMQPPAQSGAPAPAAPTTAPDGTPTATLPPVDNARGLPPYYQKPADLLQSTGLSPERLDQEARTFMESGPSSLYHGGPSGDPLALFKNEAIRRRATQMQGYLNQILADAKANRGKPGYDPESVFQRAETVDPGMAAIARRIDSGDVKAPTSYSTQRSAFARNLMSLVNTADPNFSEYRYPLKYRTGIAFAAGGKQGQQVTSLNTVMQHMAVLLDRADKLHNLSLTDVNAVKNFFNQHKGNPEITEFLAAQQAVGDEEERAFRGTGGAESEIKRTLGYINQNSSPEQIHGYIRTVAELLKGQMDSLAVLKGGDWSTITGDSLLTPQARQVYNDIIKRIPLGSGDVPLPRNTTANIELDPKAPFPPQENAPTEVTVQPSEGGGGGGGFDPTQDFDH